MKQSVKLILLAVLFCAYCTMAQEEEVTDLESESDPPVNFPDEIYENGTNALDTKRTGRINGGTTVSIKDYPYLATLIITDTSNTVFYRTGAIISYTTVITMALDRAPLEPPISSIDKVRAGSNFVDKEGFTFDVLSWKNHDMLDVAVAVNFVGVVTIKGSFSGYANVQPIAVATSEIPSSPTVSCMMIGWGRDTMDAKVDSLKRANYNLGAYATCNMAFPFLPPSTQCFEPVSGISCYGDLGTPIVCNNALYGISLGFQCKADFLVAVKLPVDSILTFLTPYLPPKKPFKCPCNAC